MMKKFFLVGGIAIIAAVGIRILQRKGIIEFPKKVRSFGVGKGWEE